MTQARDRLLGIVLAAAATLAVGTLGFMTLEHWGLVESLYMTVITLTTVGFGEVRPLDTAGRLFTTGLILLGAGLAVYTATVVGQLILDGSLGRYVRRHRMERRISHLDDHCIVCGCGRTGEEVVSLLKERRIPFVVLDPDPSVAARLDAAQVPCIAASGHDNEALERAGVSRARALVSCASNDAENVFIVLTARSIRPDLPIASRCEQQESEEKLRRAGATHVINPFSTAGRSLVTSLYRPAFFELLQTAGQPSGGTDFEEYTVDAEAAGAGRTIGELKIRADYEVSILVLRRENGEVVSQPGPETRFEVHDRIVALGPTEQLRRLRGILEKAAAGGSTS